MLKLFLIFIFMQAVAYSQTKDINYMEEISIETVNVPLQESITFTLTSIGTCWANDLITQNFLVAKETTYGNTENVHYGFAIFWETAPFEYFAHGLYKFTSTEGENYVIFDFRDCQFANKSGYLNYSTDFKIKYDANTNDFYYKDNKDVNYNLIPPESLIQIWKIKNGNPVTACFENFWQNCLVSIPEEESDNISTYYVSHLVWGPKPNFNATG